MSVKLMDLKGRSFKCIIGVNLLSTFGVCIDFLNNILFLKLKNKVIPFVKNNENIESMETPPYDYGEIFHIEKNELNIESLVSKECNMEEINATTKLLKKNKSIFFQEGQHLSASTSVKHKIITHPHHPIFVKNYRQPFALENEVNLQIDSMLNDGIIRPSKSPYNSPLWIVPKKMDNSGKQKWRLVVDFRKLNQVTIDDKFPLPNIESIFEKLGRANYFSTIDLAKGFHQILMEENDIEKTAFSSSKGHFEFVRMLFGLKNAPATFQRLMNHVLSEHINKICVIYMDDILVFSTSLSEHLESLQKIFNCLHEHNLKIQADKCIFLCKQTNFLGHLITPNGIKPNEEKIMAIQNIEIPKTVKEIRAFLGLTGYYRKFIHNYALIAAPIIKYLKKNMKIDIADIEYVQAFHKLKTILTLPPLLAYPDVNKKFVVHTDASNIAIGAVLSQNGRPINYASRTLNNHEQRYHTLEKEMLAVVWAVKYFRPYLFGRRFLLKTDHQPLKWLFTLKDPNSRVLRWQMLLREYTFDIEFVKGKENSVADFLSRNVKTINNIGNNKGNNENDDYNNENDDSQNL